MNKRKIKVANIIEEGRLGGPQIRIAEVARILNNEKFFDFIEGDVHKKKIDTTVFFPFIDGERFKKLLDRYNVSYKQFPLHRLTKTKKHLMSYILFFPHEIWLLYRFLKKNKFDIVHVSGGSWQIKGIIAGRMAGCKVLWHLNDTKMPGFVRLFFKPFANIFANGFIVSADRVKKYYLGDLKISDNKPVFQIYPPVDCSHFNPSNVKNDFQFPKSEIKIITIGNINPTKGIEYFVKMASILNKKFKNLKFYAYGSEFESQSSYIKLVKKLKNDLKLTNFHLCGATNDVRSVLFDADIFVCSSLSEAGPMTLWEAMAMGKPVVSTDVGDVSRFIKNGYNGYIAEIKNEHSLAENVSKVIDNGDESKLFGKRSREIALKNFETQIIAKKHFQAYTYI